jgi:ParB/RepB/Spo0J family partition protein
MWMESEVIPVGNLLNLKRKSRNYDARLFRTLLDPEVQDKSFLTYCRKKHLKNKYWQGEKEIKLLSRDKLTPHPLHPRRLISPRVTKNLGNALLFHQIREPLLVLAREDKPGHYYILDGKRRWLGAEYADIPLLPCVVQKNLTETEILITFAVNDGLDLPYTIIERGMLYLSLRQSLEMSQRELANFIRIPQSCICRCERTVKCLHPEIIEEYLQENATTLKNRHILKLIQLPDDPDKQLEFYQLAKTEGWSSVRLGRHIESYLQQLELNRTVEVEGEAFKAKLIPNKAAVSEIQVFTNLAQFCLATFKKFGIQQEQQQGFFQRMATHFRNEIT